MCGICCVVTFSVHPPKRCLLEEDILCNLRRRGPNSSQQLLKAVLLPPYQCLFSGHVLHFRGGLTPQPMEDPISGNVFLWNGEVFSGIPVEAEQNDTQVIFHQLCSCNCESDVLSLLSSIQGPWSFIFYQASRHLLWFGRDYFGRRSLLWQFNKEIDKVLVLTSVSAVSDHQWWEVPASGIFKLDLQACAASKAVALTWHPWKYPSRGNAIEEAVIGDSDMVSKYLPSHVSLVMDDSLCLVAPVVPLNKEIRGLPEEPQFSDLTQNVADARALQTFLAEHHKKKQVHQFIDVLSTAVKRRVFCLARDPEMVKGEMSGAALRSPYVAILFSGGVDSILLAALADRHVPSEEPIDLLNVAFKITHQDGQNNPIRKRSKEKKQLPLNQECLNSDNVMIAGSSPSFNVPDRITGRAGLEELKNINPSRHWNFVEINVPLEDLKALREQHIRHLVYPLDTVLDDSIGCAVWFASRGEGLITNQGTIRPYRSPAKVRNCLLT